MEFWRGAFDVANKLSLEKTSSATQLSDHAAAAAVSASSIVSIASSPQNITVFDWALYSTWPPAAATAAAVATAASSRLLAVAAAICKKAGRPSCVGHETLREKSKLLNLSGGKLEALVCEF